MVPAVAEPNSDVIPDLHIAWEFGDEAWQGTFTNGLLAGQGYRIALENFSREHWDRIAQLHSYDVSYDDADFATRRDAAFRHVEYYCGTLLSTPPPASAVVGTSGAQMLDAVMEP